jgi:hypothetical protein
MHAYAETGATGGVLAIQNSQTGVRYELPIDELAILTIRFFHSYDRQWVEESFRIKSNLFIPVEVIFIDDSYDYRHQRYQSRQVFDQKKVRISDIKPLPSDNLHRIITRIAFTRSQELILNGSKRRHVYKFYEWGQPGQRLVFSVE